MRALSSVWTEYLASDQAAVGSNPAAPIRFPNSSRLQDGSLSMSRSALTTEIDQSSDGACIGASGTGAGGSWVPNSGWVSSIHRDTIAPEMNIKTAVM